MTFQTAVHRVVTALAGISLAGPVSALTITSGSSSAIVDPESVFGLSSWTIDGQEQIFEQWFWYRLQGMDSESSLDSLPLLDQQLSGDRLELTYGSTDLGVGLAYTLSAGSAWARLLEEITLINPGPEPLSLAWFAEVDFDLNGTSLGDTAFGGLGGITQADGGTGATVQASIGPSAFQIAPSPFLFLSLTDDAPTTLDDSGSPSGLGDLSFAFQWNLVIPAGQSQTLTLTKEIVPEPGTWLLVGSGVAAWLAKRRLGSSMKGGRVRDRLPGC
jgi:hypothetical protein